MPLLTRAQFWNIIDAARRKSGHDLDALHNHLLDALVQLSAPDIARFQQYYQAYHEASNTPAIYMAAWLADCGTDDSFEYFRGWLIAQGKTVFLNALENPDTLAAPTSPLRKTTAPVFEQMLGIGAEALADKLNDTGNSFPDADSPTAPHALTPADHAALRAELHFHPLTEWGDDEDSLIEKIPATLPKLSKLTKRAEEPRLTRKDVQALTPAQRQTLAAQLQAQLAAIAAQPAHKVPDWCNLSNRIQQEVTPRQRDFSGVVHDACTDAEVTTLPPPQKPPHTLTAYQIYHGKNLRDLSRLADFPNLTRLEIHDFDNGCPHLTDLAPLASLTRLRELNIGKLQHLTNIDILRDLPALEHLCLFDLPLLTDLSPLAQLTQLKGLVLFNCPEITALPDLSRHTALKHLRVMNCPRLADITGIRASTSLHILELQHAEIEDLTPLENLRALRHLDLDRNRITDIAPLRNLPALEILTLNRNKISDLHPLADKPRLTILDLEANKITDLSPLAQLPNLCALRLAKNKTLTDITPLINLPHLEHLTLNRTAVKDTAVLKHIRHIEA